MADTDVINSMLELSARLNKSDRRVKAYSQTSALFQSALEVLLETNTGVVLETETLVQRFELEPYRSEFLFLFKNADGRIDVQSLAENAVLKHGSVVKLNG